jgi:hypothetical protein
MTCKRSWPILRHCTGIVQEGLGKNMKTFSHDSWFQRRDSNRSLYECKASVHTPLSGRNENKTYAQIDGRAILRIHACISLWINVQKRVVRRLSTQKMVVAKIFEVMSKTFMRSIGNLEFCGQKETIRLHNYFYLGLIYICFILDINGRICVIGVTTCFLNGLL